jgi:hypothetical protein
MPIPGDPRNWHRRGPGLPGDLSQLGLNDPLMRDNSWLYPTMGRRSNEEIDRINRDFHESQRREHRQFENQGSGASMKKMDLNDPAFRAMMIQMLMGPQGPTQDEMMQPGLAPPGM